MHEYVWAGLSKPEIIRCLQRYAARETYRYLRPADHPGSGGGLTANRLPHPRVLAF